MKNVFLFIMISIAAMVQVSANQDYMGAISVCQDTYVQPNSNFGVGN